MYLRELVGRGDLGFSTAQNRLFSVNRTMTALRSDQCVKAQGRTRQWVRSAAWFVKNLKRTYKGRPFLMPALSCCGIAIK